MLTYGPGDRSVKERFIRFLLTSGAAVGLGIVLQPSILLPRLALSGLTILLVLRRDKLS